jgi:hypothetical protein
MSYDSAFIGQVIGDVAACFRLAGVKWMTTLLEQDYLFEQFPHSAISRNSIGAELRSEELKRLDMLLIGGWVFTATSSKELHKKDESRWIAFVKSTITHGLYRLGCIDVFHCQSKNMTSPEPGQKREIKYNESTTNDFQCSFRDHCNNTMQLWAFDLQDQVVLSDQENFAMVNQFLRLDESLSTLFDVAIARVMTTDICESSPILFVTFFKEIFRGNWNSSYQRSNDEYFRHFSLLVENLEYPLIVYAENDTIQMLLGRFQTVISTKKIEFRDIGSVESAFDRFAGRHQDIIDSDSYQALIPAHRKDKPEHLYGNYTSIMSSKIDYVVAARQEFLTCSYYAFIDFGYVRRPESAPRNLDFTKLFPNKIVVPVMKVPEVEHVLSRHELLATDEVFVQGSTFIVPNRLVSVYQKLWHTELDNYHSDGIIDDDQSIVYRITVSHPKYFTFVFSHYWFSLYSSYLNSVRALQVSII